MAHLEYKEHRVFKLGHIFNYSDSQFSFRGKLFEVNLYDIQNGEDVAKKLVEPALELFRQEIVSGNKIE